VTGAVILPLTHKQPCTVDPLNPSHVIELQRTLESSELGCEVLRRVMAKVEGRKPVTPDLLMLKVLRATLLAYHLDDDLVESIMGGVIARIGEADKTREDFMKGVYTPNEVRAMFDQMMGGATARTGEIPTGGFVKKGTVVRLGDPLGENHSHE
jgi:hypothetical protein